MQDIHFEILNAEMREKVLELVTHYTKDGEVQITPDEFQGLLSYCVVIGRGQPLGIKKLG